MKKIWKYFFLLISTSTGAQNLVPNPSFEDTVACPIGIGNINYATGWSSFRTTPDYLNVCNIGQAGVPSNLFGFQYARTGNAYAGFYSMSTLGGEYREIIGVQLSQQLNIGQKYFVSMFISRGYNPAPGVHINVATNKIGVRFSTVAFSPSDPIPNDNYSQIYTDSIISDTLNWVEISGSFVADSAYEYISIGNFFTDSATSYIRYDSVTTLSYYFVDDISVMIDTTTEITSISKSPDIVKIFPNPVSDWIEIEGQNLKSVSVFNVLGEQCLRSSLTSPSVNKIDISSLQRGIYFLRVDDTNKFYLKKIILN